MFVFPDPVRKAFEALPLPLVIEQFIDEKVVPLLVSDGFCRLVGKNRESTMEWFFGSQYERLHPDDVGNVAHVSDEVAAVAVVADSCFVSAEFCVEVVCVCVESCDNVCVLLSVDVTRKLGNKLLVSLDLLNNLLWLIVC